jgi:hypothetical protein
MTTNRVRSIDGAVQSRIQLAIQYHDLKLSQREAIYLNRLNYIPDNEIGNRAELERGLKNSHLVKNRSSTVKPNGRQIRNIVTYARALAKSEDRLIELDHFIRVTDTTEQFTVKMQDLLQKQRHRNELDYEE